MYRPSCTKSNRLLGKGVTRRVYRLHHWAIKMPGGWAGWGPAALTRGWLANQSEWRQRKRTDVARPKFHLGHLLQVYPIGLRPRTEDWWEQEVRPVLRWSGYDEEESKHCSWARFGDEWLLVDFDRYWQEPCGLVRRMYDWLQEREGQRYLDSLGINLSDSVVVSQSHANKG